MMLMIHQSKEMKSSEIYIRLPKDKKKRAQKTKRKQFNKKQRGIRKNALLDLISVKVNRLIKSISNKRP